ncbi:MAG: alpha/beta hydrolase [Anaerolineaceae bacterium]|nr:alpha/beta hydrolase [Anaerolineaceae bacterium]
MGQEIHFELINPQNTRAPWLIMVHGFTHNSGYFTAQIPVFQHNYRLCLVDLRGHGKSGDVPGPFGVEEYADDLFDVLDKAKIDQAHFWGTHTGSAIALIMALRQPERFKSLILEGTFLPGFPMPRVGELINRARKIAKENGIPNAREDWFNHADWFDVIRANPNQCRAAAHHQLVDDFEGAPWLSDLPALAVTPAANFLNEIHMPVLVYNGEHDLPDFKQAANFLKANLPNVQQAIIPNGGGFPAWEYPDTVNKLVKSYLYQLQGEYE